MDLLRAKGVRPFDKRMFVQARTGRLALIHRRVEFLAAEEKGFGAFMRARGCPCGGGEQTLRHVCRYCECPEVVKRRMRVIECMEAVDSEGKHEQWAFALKTMKDPKGRRESGVDVEVDECLLGIVVPGWEGAAKKARSRAAGSFVRAMSGLLEAGVRVADRARREGREEYDRRCDLRKGMAGMRAEAVAATPREQAECRRGRVMQEECGVRLARRGYGVEMGRVLVRDVWRRHVRRRGRWREEVLEDEVWLRGHLRLWRLARTARLWQRGFRARRAGRSQGDVALLEAGVSEEEMGVDLAAEVREGAEKEAALLRARRAVQEAERRVGVMVYGLYFKVCAEGGKRRGGRGMRSGVGGKRGRVEARRELRGKERMAEVSEAMRNEEMLERRARGGVVAALDDGNWVCAQPVPCWASRQLRPGEWREREGEGGMLKRQKLRASGTYFTKRARISAIAEAAGLHPVSTKSEGTEHVRYKVRRLECGADVSGVT